MIQYMAKSGGGKRVKARGVGLKRRIVVKDDRLLSPVFADFSTIILSGDMVIQKILEGEKTRQLRGSDSC